MSCTVYIVNCKASCKTPLFSIVEEQIDNNSNDFKGWMKCVTQVEEKRNEIFVGNQFG